jgi:hypothetical protein
MAYSYDKDLTAWVAELRDAPGRAWQDVRAARFGLERAQANAEGVKSVRYDTDKVQGGTPRGMAENVETVMEAEEKLASAMTRYNCAALSFKHVLERARALSVFDELQANLWWEYYRRGSGHVSLQKLATKNGLTKRRVQYLLKDWRAVGSFKWAVESVIGDIEWDELEEERAMEYYDDYSNEIADALEFENERRNALY